MPTLYGNYDYYGIIHYRGSLIHLLLAPAVPVVVIIIVVVVEMLEGMCCFSLSLYSLSLPPLSPFPISLLSVSLFSPLSLSLFSSLSLPFLIAFLCIIQFVIIIISFDNRDYLTTLTNSTGFNNPTCVKHLKAMLGISAGIRNTFIENVLM